MVRGDLDVIGGETVLRCVANAMNAHGVAIDGEENPISPSLAAEENEAKLNSKFVRLIGNRPHGGHFL